nr:hypothetical protein CFP56_15107 [Quercus suber]
MDLARSRRVSKDSGEIGFTQNKPPPAGDLNQRIRYCYRSVTGKVLNIVNQVLHLKQHNGLNVMTDDTSCLLATQADDLANRRLPATVAEHWQQDLLPRRLTGILDSKIEANTKEGLAMPGINRTRILSFLDFLPSFL